MKCRQNLQEPRRLVWPTVSAEYRVEPIQKIRNEHFKIIADSLEHIYASKSAPLHTFDVGQVAPDNWSYMAPLVDGEMRLPGHPWGSGGSTGGLRSLLG